MLCIRCGKTYKTLPPFITHLTKYGKCIAKYIDIPKKHYKENIKSINFMFKIKFEKLYDETPNKSKFGCLVCGGLYNDSSYYYKHLKVCKDKEEKKQQLENMDEPDVNKLLSELQILKTTNQKTITKTNSNNKEEHHINHHQSHNTNNDDHVENHYQNNNSQSHNTHSNNGNNSGNNNVINNVNTYVINNYDDAELHDKNCLNLPKHIKKKLFNAPRTAIPELYNKYYIDIPENRCIYISNIKDGQAYAMKDGKWTCMGMNQLMEHMLEQISDQIYHIGEFGKLNITEKKRENMERTLEEVAENGKYANSCKQIIKNTTFNKRDSIKKTYEEVIGHKVKLNMKPIKGG